MQRELHGKQVAEISDPTARRTAAALSGSQIGVFEYEPETDLAFWDERVRRFWGIGEVVEITYELIISHVHPDDRALHDDCTAKALDPTGDGHMDMIYRLYPGDGHPMRWVHAVANCHFEGDRAVRLVGTVQDITEQRRAQEQNKLLVNELEHRVKNTLATAIAIVSLSRAGSDNIDTYCNAVDARLRSLATSQDLLRRTDWTAVPFEVLLAAAVGSFLGAESDRINLLGDELQIPAKTVMTLSMALHELLTNSVKYGALAVPDGHIDVELSSDASHTKLCWREHGALPVPVTAESQNGFGTVLLKEILPREVNGDLDLDFKKSGLVYTLRMPNISST